MRRAANFSLFQGSLLFGAPQDTEKLDEGLFFSF